MTSCGPDHVNCSISSGPKQLDNNANYAISRSLSKAIVPAVRRAASSAIPAAKQSTQEGFKLVEVLYAVPPLLAIVGYGGTVCYHESGALRRIRRSFAEVPH